MLRALWYNPINSNFHNDASLTSKIQQNLNATRADENVFDILDNTILQYNQLTKTDNTAMFIESLRSYNLFSYKKQPLQVIII